MTNTLKSADGAISDDLIRRIEKSTEEGIIRRKERRQALRNRTINRDVRIVAWVDILGFSNEMLRATTDEEYRAAYRKMLYVHEQLGHPHADEEPEDRVRINTDYGRTVTALSDGVVVTASGHSEAASVMTPYDFFMDFIQDIQWAQAHCAVNGIFLRGGISIGPYYHEDDILLSPALIRAYKLETQRASYPAIIISASDMNQLTALQGRNHYAFPDDMVLPFKSPAQRRGEKFLFIDYLRFLRHPDNHGWFSNEDFQAFRRLRDHDSKTANKIFTKSHRREAARFMRLHKIKILDAFRSAPNEKVKAKYRWLAKYHNRSLRGFPREFKSAIINLARM